MGAAIYEISDLLHRYNRRTVLDVGAFTIDASAIIGIIGPNGSGKSTLLKLMAFVEKPTAGTIRFMGVPTDPFSENARFRVSLLTQEPYLLKRSVYRNIAYGLHLRRERSGIRDRVYRAMNWVGLSGDDFAHRRWYELSGGEAQRVALAARLVLEPQVLLMDEPTASVDAGSAQLIKEAALRARRQWGTTLIVASHDWPWLYEICDEVRHLFKGRFSGAGHENVIYGPWEQDEAGRWGKVLAYGQMAAASPPPHPKAVAIISSANIRLHTEPFPATGAATCIRGSVSRLIHERPTGNIIVTVLVDNIPFTVSMTRDAQRRADLYPGREVFVTYDPEQVRWTD